MLRGFGVDLVIDEVASELTRRGHDVTVYASLVDGRVPRPYRVDSIPTRASGLPPRYESAARSWVDYIDAHNQDIVFIESHPFFSLIPHLRTPAVVVDHGVSSTRGMSARQKIAFKYIEWVQQNRYFPKAAGLVTVSEFIRSLLPRRLHERTRVIYNGSDHYPAASQVDRQAMRKRLGISDERVMMLYVGRLNPEGQPYKGTADLVRIMARWCEEAPDIAVVMAGRGDNADATLIRRSGGIPLIDVPDDEMGALYAAADIYPPAAGRASISRS
jgi:glycosyltransferase involved in cell wall biosynthesis